MITYIAIYFVFVLINHTLLGNKVSRPIKDFLICSRYRKMADIIRYVIFGCAVCFTFWCGILIAFKTLTIIELCAALACIYIAETVTKKLQILIDETKKNSSIER